LLSVALTRKRSRNNNNIAAPRLAGHRQCRHLADPRKWQRLTGHHQVNLMDRHQVSLSGNLQGRA
jgi:hypothetical protein